MESKSTGQTEWNILDATLPQPELIGFPSGTRPPPHLSYSGLCIGKLQGLGAGKGCREAGSVSPGCGWQPHRDERRGKQEACFSSCVRHVALSAPFSDWDHFVHAMTDPLDEFLIGGLQGLTVLKVDSHCLAAPECPFYGIFRAQSYSIDF